MAPELTPVQALAGKMKKKGTLVYGPGGEAAIVYGVPDEANTAVPGSTSSLEGTTLHGSLPTAQDLTSGSTLPRLSRYEELVERVVEVFGNESMASEWLSLRSSDFGGKTPLEVAAQQGYESQVLEPILSRLEHGIEF